LYKEKVRENPDFIVENINDICASIQYTIVEILMDKLKLAVKETGINKSLSVVVVSANSGIRKAKKTQNKKIRLENICSKI
jgi:N6-L-threonylcarbamoyladenine synthase